MTLEGVEVFGPQAAVWLEPFLEGVERMWFDPVDALLCCRTAGDEAGFAQHLQVLGHRGLADRERFDKLTDAALRPTELVENAAPGWLGEYAKRVPRHTVNMLFTAYTCQGL